MEVFVDEFIEENKMLMEETMEHLGSELSKIRAGKANTRMVDGINVDYYGTPTPITQIANVSTSDSRTIVIQPWEKSMLANIEQAIFKANLGFTPMNDGEVVRIPIPMLTEERRLALVKQVKQVGEEAKISLRHSRHKIMDFLKKEIKNGYPEDLGKRKEDSVEKMVLKFSSQIDKIIEAKESELMTV